MELSITKEPNKEQLEQLISLWNKEYPVQLAYRELSEFRSYLAGLVHPTHYFLTAERTSEISAQAQALRPDTKIVLGWAFTFTRSGERWFAIILDSGVQHRGYGTSLLNTIKKEEQTLNGWVTDHDRYVKQDKTPYPSPLAFYLKNNFSVCEDTRLETDKLSAVKIQWSRQL